MASPSGRSIDYWRKFFRSACSDIFEVIEQAIVVAASDRPEEFRSRRDRIGEKFYTALLRRCGHCDPVELQGVEREVGHGSVRRIGEKESKIDSSIDDLECSNNPPAMLSDYTYDDEADARAGDIEEEGQKIGEILRIKEILHNEDFESDDVLLESLRRLKQMELTVDVLKETEIGKAVNGILKCSKSKQIRQLARTIVGGWKVFVDEWISANAAGVADNSPADTQEPSPVNDEGGLPSPPLEEGTALLAFHQTSSTPLSQNSDRMDYDGNLRNIEEFDNSQKFEQRLRGKDETVKRSSTSARPKTTLANEQKVGSNTKAKPPQRKPLAIIQDGSKNTDDSAMEARLEIAKRKLHQGYQQAENAKKQRTIQIMEQPDIPKQAQSSQPTLKIKIPFKLRSNAR